MSGRVTRRELAEILGERTLHMSDKGQLAKHVAAYLVSERQNIDLSSLLRDVMQYRLEQGVVEAVAVSAHEITPVVIKDVEDVLRDHFPDAKTIRVDTRVDPNVIGGIRIELPQETLDLSVRSKLNLFKRLVAEERN